MDKITLPYKTPTKISFTIDSIVKNTSLGTDGELLMSDTGNDGSWIPINKGITVGVKSDIWFYQDIEDYLILPVFEV